MLAEMNVLNLQGKLTPAQSAFFAPTKPEIELFDLRTDPHEVDNIADDPEHAELKARLLAQLNDWRENVILDKGIDEDFLGAGVFPETCPLPTVDAWVTENKSNFDFKRYGVPSWYPTRTLEEWSKARETWAPYVFRSPDSNLRRPKVVGL